MNLFLSEGAVVKFSTDPKQYLPLVYTRFEGTELMNYSPFIYAFDEQDIAITGPGTLDGQADATHWWDWTRNAARRQLVDAAAAGKPVAERIFGEGSFLRPNFIQPYRCRNVMIEGVTIVNSPMWEINPVLSTNVIVRGVTINSHGPNNDGCDPEACRDVLIERCTFDTGDDCIALKSGRNDDGRRVGVPIENVIIRDCTMKDGHGGVTIGSEISGGARNIFAERCRMDSPNLNIALRFKTNSVRGGVIEHVFMRDVTIGQVSQAVVSVDFLYEEGDAGKFTPIVRDIEVRNVTSQKSRNALSLRGYARSPVTNVRLKDCKFENVAQPDVLENVKDIFFLQCHHQRQNHQPNHHPVDIGVRIRSIPVNPVRRGWREASGEGYNSQFFTPHPAAIRESNISHFARSRTPESLTFAFAAEQHVDGVFHGAGGNDLSGIHKENFVRIGDRIQAMRDDDFGCRCRQLVQNS